MRVAWAGVGLIGLGACPRSALMQWKIPLLLLRDGHLGAGVVVVGVEGGEGVAGASVSSGISESSESPSSIGRRSIRRLEPTQTTRRED